MLDVDEALTVCRLFAAMAGDPLLGPDDAREGPDDLNWRNLANAVERLLFELEVARADAEQYQKQLKEWGVPTRQRLVRKLETKGFERGWGDTNVNSGIPTSARTT